ncbi:UDP-GalNAc:beta-1,3-N-acetylgalactosaminyltransferase 2 [Striga asiatica]|uniref:UDP-GalNAc:beta-1,3-N-acetylgalactosaminyltransferase 2 n=1 Tax=Striga asiatica TaxID=4170 RepID=A0A5A7PTP4_STRAF|nr:UDP-GalNAc:beta-1,3-N-acetylgalactosaminyltransferase 2 [Striga asiatica]
MDAAKSPPSYSFRSKKCEAITHPIGSEGVESSQDRPESIEGENVWEADGFHEAVEQSLHDDVDRRNQGGGHGAPGMQIRPIRRFDLGFSKFDLLLSDFHRCFSS